MSKNIFYFTLFLLMFFLSCKHERINSNIEKIKIKTHDVSSKEIPFFDKVEIIKIPKINAGKIREIKVLCNDKILLRMSSGKERVYLFFLKDSLLKPIALKGNAPNEFSNVDDICIDSSCNIYILDKLKKKLYQYDSVGELVQRFTLPDFFSEIQIHRNRLFVFKNLPFNRNDDYRINILAKSVSNHNGYVTKTKKYKLGKLFEERDLPHYNPLFVYNKNLYYVQSFNDTIYTIADNGNLKAKYILDFTPYKLPYDLFYNSKLELFDFVEKVRAKPNTVWGISYYFENDNFIFLKYFLTRKNLPFFSIYNKKTKQSYTYQKLNFNRLLGIKDLEIGDEFFPAYINNDYLYFIIEPYYLLELKDIGDFKEIKLLEKLKYDDNPLILKVQLAKT